MAPWRSPRTLVVEPAISVPCLLLLEGFSDAVQISQGVENLAFRNQDPAPHGVNVYGHLPGRAIFDISR